ncbi:hypothetical protein B5S33_g4304 [[Candida] boidinii]|nr:hypothetical protein B5S33_g4304 [[Candida] boidinii]
MRRHIRDLLIQTKDTDPDLRFMALADFEKEITSSSNADSVYSNDDKIDFADALITCLDDETPEVRAQSLKCFETITPILGSYISEVLERLVMKKPEKISITTTIYTMAILNIIKRIVINEQLAKDINRKLLINIIDMSDSNSSNYVLNSIDSIEILMKLLESFYKYLNPNEINFCTEVLLKTVYESDTIISNKAVLGLGFLSKSLDLVQFEKVLNNLKFNSFKNNLISLNVLISLIKNNPKLSANFFSYLWKKINENLLIDEIHNCNDDFDKQQECEEIRNESLNLLIAMIDKFDNDLVEPYVDECLNISSVFVSYDPYKDGDEEEDDELSDEFNDYSEDEDEQEDYGEDDDSEGLSWKLRRASVRLISVLLENYPMILPKIYKHSFNNLVKQLNEKNKIVLFELVKCCTQIFKFTSKNGSYYTNKFLNSIKESSNTSTSSIAFSPSKRRSSDVSMMIVSEDDQDGDPLNSLFSQLDLIYDLSIKNLIISKHLNDFPSIYSFYIELLVCTDGAITEGNILTIIKTFLNIINNLIINSDLLNFFFLLIKIVDLNAFNEDSFKLITDSIINCINNTTNHELILESLNLIESILDKNIEAKETKFNSILVNLYDLMAEKIENKVYSIEIRIRSLKCLSKLILNLNDVNVLNRSLLIFENCLHIEFLVLIDLSYITNLINVFSIDSNFINKILRPTVEYTSINELQLKSLELLNAITTKDYINEIDDVALIVDSIIQISGNNNINELIINIIDNLIRKNSLNHLTDEQIDIIVSHFIKFTKNPKFNSNLLINFTKILNTRLIEINKSNLLLKKLDKTKQTNICKILAIISIDDNNLILKTLDNIRNDEERNEENVLFSIIFIDQIATTIGIDCNLNDFVKFLKYSTNNEIKTAAINCISSIIIKDSSKYLVEFINILNESSESESDVDTISVLKIFKNIKDKLNIEFIEKIISLILELRLVGSNRLSQISDENKELNKIKEINGVKINELEYNLNADLISDLILQLDESTQTEIITFFCNDLIVDNEVGSKDTKSTIKSIIIGVSFKYLIEKSIVKDNLTTINFLNDNLNLLIKFLKLTSITDNFLFNEDLNLKQTGVSNLIIALHKLPIISLPIITNILPRILETELDINKKYIKVISIGPFKHKFDDAINIRKSIYELIYSLILTIENNLNLKILYKHLNFKELFKIILNKSFKDDSTILSISLITLYKIITINLDSIFIGETGSELIVNMVTLINKILNKKLKESSTKQELEKHNESIKAILRFSKKINDLIESSQLKISNNNDIIEWENFIKNTKIKFPIFKNEE